MKHRTKETPHVARDTAIYRFGKCWTARRHVPADGSSPWLSDWNNRVGKDSRSTGRRSGSHRMNGRWTRSYARSTPVWCCSGTAASSARRCCSFVGMSVWSHSSPHCSAPHGNGCHARLWRSGRRTSSPIQVRPMIDGTGTGPWLLPDPWSLQACFAYRQLCCRPPGHARMSTSPRPLCFVHANAATRIRSSVPRNHHCPRK